MIDTPAGKGDSEEGNRDDDKEHGKSSIAREPSSNQ